MGRTIFATEVCQKKLEHYAQYPDSFCYGLVIGQFNSAQDTIVHIAPTPKDTTSQPSSSSEIIQNKTVADISEVSFADHTKHVTRMLPGGFFVQGLFISSGTNVFEDTTLNKLRNVLSYACKTLDANKFMYASPPSPERVIIHIEPSSKAITCKSIDILSRNNPTKIVELKFLQKAFLWQKIECRYEFDEIYPVVAKKKVVSVREQFQNILKSSNCLIENSVIFIDGESYGLNEQLDVVAKNKRKSSKTKDNVLRPMHASIFVTTTNEIPQLVEYLECEGSIHFSGIVASIVFLNVKSTIGETYTALKQDIMRSLASRFTMHCDALIDDNLLPEERVCFNEPPRRVYINLKDSECLQFCDYLFPGEAPAEALLSVKELLDLEIVESDVVCTVETPADTAEFDALDRDALSEESLVTPQETHRFMYISGFSVAVIVLILSVLVHYRHSIFSVFK